jgi:hypothetical protein
MLFTYNDLPDEYTIRRILHVCVLVIREWTHRIQRWSPGSRYGVTVAAASPMYARGMAFDPSGNLVVADQSYHRILLFSINCCK